MALDVQRSLVHYAGAGAPPERERAMRRRQLSALICGTLRKYPSLHYFQGYHDVVSVVLLTLCPTPPPPGDGDQIWTSEQEYNSVQQAVDRLSLHFVRDSMTPDLLPIMSQLKVVRNILRAADPPYAKALEQAFYPNLLIVALPWVLTLFTHDLPRLGDAQLVLGFVLEHGPSSVLYVAAALLLWYKEQVPPDEAQSIGEMSHLHRDLSQLPERVVFGEVAERGPGAPRGGWASADEKQLSGSEKQLSGSELQEKAAQEALEDAKQTPLPAGDAGLSDGDALDTASGAKTEDGGTATEDGTTATEDGGTATEDGEKRPPESTQRAEAEPPADAAEAAQPEATQSPDEPPSALPAVLARAHDLLLRYPLDGAQVHAHTMLAKEASALFTWPAATSAAPDERGAQDDAALHLLTLPTSSIALDALPSPPPTPDTRPIQRTPRRGLMPHALAHWLSTQKRHRLRWFARTVPLSFFSLLLGSSLLSLGIALYLADWRGGSLPRLVP